MSAYAQSFLVTVIDEGKQFKQIILHKVSPPPYGILTVNLHSHKVPVTPENFWDKNQKQSLNPAQRSWSSILSILSHIKAREDKMVVSRS